MATNSSRVRLAAVVALALTSTVALAMAASTQDQQQQSVGFRAAVDSSMLPPDPPPTDWIKRLRELLCKMYQEWGGDCSQLPALVPDQIATLWSEYGNQGAPGFPNQQDEDDYVALLLEVLTHLDSPANELSPTDSDSLRMLVEALLAEYGHLL